MQFRFLVDWCEAYLRDVVDSDGTAEDVTDEVITREATNLNNLLYKTASSFVDNEFERN